MFAWAFNNWAQFILFYVAFILAALGLSTCLDTILRQHGALKTRGFLDTISAPLLFIRSRMKAWSFLVQGPEIIQTAYDKVFYSHFVIASVGVVVTLHITLFHGSCVIIV